MTKIKYTIFLIILTFVGCIQVGIKEIINDNAVNSKSIKYGMPKEEVYELLKVDEYRAKRPDFDQPFISKVIVGKDMTPYYLDLFHIEPSGFGSNNFYHNKSFMPLLFKSDSLVGINWDDFDAIVKDTIINDSRSESKKNNRGNNKTNSNKKLELFSTGTGFLIHPNGYIVTNYHVIENFQKIIIYLPKLEKSFEAKIKLKDEFNDLVIIQITDTLFKNYKNNSIPFEFEKEAKVGQRIFTIGFPLSDVLGQSAAKLSDGLINSLTGINEDPRLYQISSPIQPGNSGGPLFDNDGNVVGIVVSTLNSIFFLNYKQIIPQNVNFAIKVNYLLNLIDMLPEKEDILSHKNILKGLELEQQFSLVQPFVV